MKKLHLELSDMNEYLILIVWCICVFVFYKLFNNIKSLVSQYEEELKKDFN